MSDTQADYLRHVYTDGWQGEPGEDKEKGTAASEVWLAHERHRRRVSRSALTLADEIESIRVSVEGED